MSKNILVTGGTSGIGRAICERFAAGGFNVITCARTPNDLEEMKSYWQRHFPNSFLITHVADLSIKDSVEDFMSSLEPNSIDILVNNTGVFQAGGVLDSNFADLDNQIKTNLYSAYFTTRGVLEIAPKVEHIFNICSIASLSALTGSGIYCISKFALYGLSQSLRLELRDQGIKVTSVLPGATWSRSWSGAELAEDRLMPAVDVAESIWMAYHTSPSTVIEEIILRPQLGDL